jgi:4-diphosphocytidyl-2-C-methyl-D-erythritol kinase
MSDAALQPGFSRWPAPAKINLFLHIVGRRADGYHELQTCFQFLSHCDDIDIRVRTDGVIQRLKGMDIAPDSDLVVRAARLLQESAHRAAGADIAVHKRIPAGAGLGGGSSDAATVLVALNKLWDLRWSNEQLQELGLRLGADVPVFVAGRAAWAEGVGEKLTFLTGAELPKERIYLIVKPNCSVSTAAVFQAPELTRNSPSITIRGFLKEGGRNDCTPTVRSRFPAVGSALDWLSKFGEARLTGTGACIFLGLDTVQDAERILRQMPPDMTGFIAQGLNESPLRGRF